MSLRTLNRNTTQLARKGLSMAQEKQGNQSGPKQGDSTPGKQAGREIFPTTQPEGEPGKLPRNAGSLQSEGKSGQKPSSSTGAGSASTPANDADAARAEPNQAGRDAGNQQSRNQTGGTQTGQQTGGEQAAS